MENNFNCETTPTELSNEKEVWSTPELVILSQDIIKGGVFNGDDGGGIFTADS
ncbi:MAG TPA: hypothetical protein VGE24_11085 [Emticicia sp.]